MGPAEFVKVFLFLEDENVSGVLQAFLGFFAEFLLVGCWVQGHFHYFWLWIWISYANLCVVSVLVLIFRNLLHRHNNCLIIIIITTLKRITMRKTILLNNTRLVRNILQTWSPLLLYLFLNVHFKCFLFNRNRRCPLSVILFLSYAKLWNQCVSIIFFTEYLRSAKSWLIYQQRWI